MRLPQPATLTHLCVISTALHVHMTVCYLLPVDVVIIRYILCGCIRDHVNEYLINYISAIRIAQTSPALAMAAPCSSLAGWIPRPAPFNASKHGTLVEFSEQYSVAERVRPEESARNGVVYTAQPVPVGEVWRITVLQNTIRKWAGGLVSGWVLCSLYCQRVVV